MGQRLAPSDGSAAGAGWESPETHRVRNDHAGPCNVGELRPDPTGARCGSRLPMQTLHILIVENDPVTAMRIASDLAGHCVAVESQPAVAASRMRSQASFDVLVCRTGMLELAGGPMLAALCALADGPVLVLTDDRVGRRALALLQHAREKPCSAVTQPVSTITPTAGV